MRGSIFDDVSAISSVNVLYVEDDFETMNLAEKFLRKFIPNLIVASDAEEALTLTEGKEIDIIITDIMMGKMDGIELATAMRVRYPFSFVILSTAFSDKTRLLQAVDLKVDKYIIKPIDWKKLIDIVNVFAERVVTYKRLRNETSDDTNNNSLVTSQMYREITAAIDDIDSAINALENEETTHNTIKSVRYLNLAGQRLKTMLADIF